MSRKDYKKGMADAMGAYEAFGEKQEAAIRHVEGEVEKAAEKVNKLGGKIGEIADYITDQEKAALYKLNTPVDIADLDDAEKRILLAVLYQLSADEDEVTEEQQNYLRAVQQYLKIYNPQTEIDLEAVENIEDISAQKAVMQAVLEFFYLGAHPGTYNDDQLDFLDCFQVNRRTRREINGHISAIVEAVGVKGLSEKYGFVAAQPKSAFAKYQDNGRIPERVADFCIAQLQGKDEDDYDGDDEEYGESRIQEFEDGQKFLETKDYIVFLKLRGTVYVEEEDCNSSQEGLFRVGKQSGKMERIQLDYKTFAKMFDKVFTQYSFYRKYHVVKNTIYFTNCTPYDKDAVTVLSVDIDQQTSKIISIPYKADDEVRVHISANESYVMVAILEECDQYDSMKPLKTYVVDLMQNDRVFVLNPGLAEVYDAFLWDEKFLFSGRKKKDCPDSLYQYNPEQKTVENILPEMDSHTSGGLRCKICRGFTLDSLMTIDQIRHLGDFYHFWASLRNPNGDNVHCCCTIHQKDGAWESLCDECDEDLHLIGLLPNCVLYTNEYDGDLTLIKADYLTGTSNWLDEDDESPLEYILLGDYLYRRYPSENWQKTNISKGLDSLQWEIVQFPD